MRTQAEIEALLQAVEGWARRQPDISALMLFGSWARGEAREASDLDIKVICDEPATYTEISWLNDIDWGAATLRDGLAESKGDYVRVLARMVPPIDLEFSISSPAWCEKSPLPLGTAKVMGNGTRILFDRDGLLAQLQSKTVST